MLTEGTQEAHTRSHSKEVHSLFDLHKLHIWIHLRTHTHKYIDSCNNNEKKITNEKKKAKNLKESWGRVVRGFGGKKGKNVVIKL